ncbi:hypothetical protein U9M48_007477 [Paspalum notatum var. saurae]|uniref:Uncharacterized protein n=1 Tax=Paspalum notatum var. saurae TaxID=547442 RepID=A0AAQ3SMI1_PASNO
MSRARDACSAMGDASFLALTMDSRWRLEKAMASSRPCLPETPSPSHLLELRLLPSHYPPRPVGDDDLRLPLVSCPRRLRESACHGWIHPERRRPYPSRGPSAGFPSQCLLFVATACGDGIGVEGINWFPSITGRPTFNLSSWFGIPGNLKLLRNSVGYIWSKLPLFVVALLTVSELWKRCWHGALPELAS